MSVEFGNKLDNGTTCNEGGRMQIEASAGEGAGPQAEATNAEGLAQYALDGEFAVIHDEPFLTIVYEDGRFRGTIVDATLDKLAEARVVAARYNLVIDHVRCDYHTNFDLHLREVHDAN